MRLSESQIENRIAELRPLHRNGSITREQRMELAELHRMAHTRARMVVDPLARGDYRARERSAGLMI